MKMTRYSEPQILSILRQAEGGVPVAELCRRHGLSPASFYIYGCLSHCKIFSELFRRQILGCALSPNTGPPEAGVFRLCHDDGLVTPSGWCMAIGTLYPIALCGLSSL